MEEGWGMGGMYSLSNQLGCLGECCVLLPVLLIHGVRRSLWKQFGQV